MTYDGDWRETFRPDIPSVARIYDYLLGGKDNYPADRAVGESMIAQLPNVRRAVQWNRAFLRRVVRYLVREVSDVERVFDEATTPAHVRSRAAIRQLVDGMDVIEPGLAWPPEWRPDPGDEVPGNAAESYYCVVVARTN